MGFKDASYLQSLQELTKKCNIEDKVIFHGFMNRLDIEKMMSDEEWTFIAPSIHSDENFGMAAFRCLLNGHQCILSDWGGHADYPEHFPHQVKLLKVYQSEIGPWISINELKSVMEENSPEFESFNVPQYYSEDVIHPLISAAFYFQEEAKTIKTQPLLEDLLQRREQFIQENKSDGSRLYYDYADKLKDPFFIAYAGGEFHKDEQNNNFVPWIERHDGIIAINDPHRGYFKVQANHPLLNTFGLGFRS